jgi:hypothetical protein
VKGKGQHGKAKQEKAENGEDGKHNIKEQKIENFLIYF